MARQHLHYRKPIIGDLVHPIDVIASSPWANTTRVGLVIDKRGLEVVVQFAGEQDEDGQPYRLWHRRMNVVTIDGVKEIP